MKLAALLLLIVLGSACQTQRNYTTSDGPRHANAPPPHIEPTDPSDTIRIVSFNIAFAMQVERAYQVLANDPALRDADIILLQEMDAPGTNYIARQLGMWYVYYPATLHIKHGRDFGNAVLSRWPIVADEKIILPHLARVYRTIRSATAATIVIGRDTVRAYSAHLGTIANINAQQRREQLQTILKDAAQYRRVIIGGDMNDQVVGRVARDAGYSWVTETGPRTATVGRLDHIFLKGLFSPATNASGTVLDVRDASDHRPVWATALLRKP
jgi:endonuclease/exonuclease/phosphatase family metal-dependent hydrolase